MNQSDMTQRAQPTEPAAFSFQLSPEPPPISRRPPDDDGVDAAWFQAPEDQEGGADVVAAASSDVATRTPPPAAGEARAVEMRAPTLPRPITIDDPLTEPPAAVTPTSGHQLSHLITQFSEPAPVVQAHEPAEAEQRLPKTKPLTFPGDMRPLAEPIERYAPANTEAKREPPPAHESVVEKRRPAPEPRPAVQEPAAVFEPARPEAASAAEEPVVSQEQLAPVKDTSTFKVIGYALVAMAFSYIGMSALVAWLSDSGTHQPDTAPIATTAQAALTDTEAADPSADGEAEEAPAPSEAQAKPAAPAPVQSAAKEQVALEDLPVPAGLALAADKGVLKIVTSDAHTLYVDGEFAGRGPVRIVPLAPGKHAIKTRFDGAEKSYEANVQAGRMTRLTISVAK